MAEETRETIDTEEQDQIQKVVKERDTIQKNRATYEKQWLVNTAFLYGKHYFTIEKSPTASLEERVHWELKNIERKKKVRRISNYILPLFRSLLARMLLMKSTITVDATTNSERDKSAAKVSQEILEDFWQMVNKHNPTLCQDYAGMLLILKKLFTYILAIGTAYLKPYFNPKTKAKTYLNKEVIDPKDKAIGEVETKVIHAFDIFKDPMGRYLIEQSIMHVDEIEEQYGIKVDAEEVTLSTTEQKLLNLLEGSKPEKYEDCVRVFEKWVVPSVSNPNGKYYVLTNKKKLFDGNLPEECKGRIPYFKFTYLDLLIASYAQGAIEQVISLQEEYNYTITRLAGYKKWMAGKVMVPSNAKLKAKWDDEVGQLIIYQAGTSPPTYQNPPSPPQFLLEELVRIKKDMEDTVSSHEASLGRTPGQAKSGVAIEHLAEMDNTQLGPELIGMETQLSFYAETVLDMMEAKYSEPRIIGITGDQLAQDVKTFKGTELKGNKRIKISLGSSLPYSKAARRAEIKDLVQREYITKEKGRELLEFGDVEGVFHSLDETLQKEEIEQLLKTDVRVQVEEWDDHTTHIKVISDFMKKKQFMEMKEEARAKFIEHRKAHQKYLMQEQQAAAKMQQPPGPAPGGGG